MSFELLSDFRIACLAALAAGGLVGACNSGNAAPTLPTFDSARAWTHLETIVNFGDRSYGQPGLEETRKYLFDQLEALGLTPVREEFEEKTPGETGKITFANVYADLPAKEGAPIVILMTHFDTKSFRAHGAPDSEGFEGANDGGSGTAVLLELARSLNAAEEPHPVKYRILFLDGEEATLWNWAGQDNTYGSRYHVRALREADELESVKAAILLDMVGDKQLKLNREGNSTYELLKIFFDAARSIGLGKHVGGSHHLIEDDHKSFIAAGVPSVDLIDFNYGPGNRYWHTNKDRLENCSKESLDAIGRIVLAGLPRVEAFALPE